MIFGEEASITEGENNVINFAACVKTCITLQWEMLQVLVQKKPQQRFSFTSAETVETKKIIPTRQLAYQRRISNSPTFIWRMW